MPFETYPSPSPPLFLLNAAAVVLHSHFFWFFGFFVFIGVYLL